MSQVRRCDYTGCTNGPDGTRAVSESANPPGWIQASRVTHGALLGADQTVNGDFDTPLCAALALFDAEPTVAVGEYVPPPPEPEPAPKKRRTRAK